MVPVLLPRKSLICMWQIYEGRKWVLALAALIMLAVTWAEHGFFRHSAGVEENPGMDPKEKQTADAISIRCFSVLNVTKQRAKCGI